MSTSRQVPVLRLAFGPSRLERRGLICLHMAALLVLLLMPMAEPVRLAGLLILALSVCLLVRRQPVSGELVLQADGGWHLAVPEWTGEARLTGRRLVTPWLVVMRLARPDRADMPLVLWPDSGSSDSLRHLRVWLRWGRVDDQRS